MTDMERIEERLIGAIEVLHALTSVECDGDSAGFNRTLGAYEAIHVIKTWLDEDCGLDTTVQKGSIHETDSSSRSTDREF